MCGRVDGVRVFLVVVFVCNTHIWPEFWPGHQNIINIDKIGAQACASGSFCCAWNGSNEDGDDDFADDDGCSLPANLPTLIVCPCVRI